MRADPARQSGLKGLKIQSEVLNGIKDKTETKKFQKSVTIGYLAHQEPIRIPDRKVPYLATRQLVKVIEITHT